MSDQESSMSREAKIIMDNWERQVREVAFEEAAVVCERNEILKGGELARHIRALKLRKPKTEPKPVKQPAKDPVRAEPDKKPDINRQDFHHALEKAAEPQEVKRVKAPEVRRQAAKPLASATNGDDLERRVLNQLKLMQGRDVSIATLRRYVRADSASELAEAANRLAESGLINQRGEGTSRQPWVWKLP